MRKICKVAHKWHMLMWVAGLRFELEIGVDNTCMFRIWAEVEFLIKVPCLGYAVRTGTASWCWMRVWGEGEPLNRNKSAACQNRVRAIVLSVMSVCLRVGGWVGSGRLLYEVLLPNSVLYYVCAPRFPQRRQKQSQSQECSLYRERGLAEDEGEGMTLHVNTSSFYRVACLVVLKILAFFFFHNNVSRFTFFLAARGGNGLPA